VLTLLWWTLCTFAIGTDRCPGDAAIFDFDTFRRRTLVCLRGLIIRVKTLWLALAHSWYSLTATVGIGSL
jgi:hypothetical protein